MNDAIAHLRAVDPVVGALIDRHGTYSPRVFHDPYARLLTSILFQQLAGSAARSIMRRWLAIYSDGERMPTPHELLATSDEQFRLAGVSKQKAGYMRDLALHVLEGRLELGRLEALPDEEVVTRLTAVKGIGVWTAHMFLMFHLARPDVLPVGDLGVRNGMRLAYGLAETPGPRQAAEIGERWRPYRSVGSWYMWRAAETVLQPASPGSAAEAAAGPQE
jgi:3-methyladenine DNA glycosylase/8-oxoguanine DNA glycosylase